MPNPSRWGVAEFAINMAVPKWVYDQVDTVRREQDYGTVSNAGLELVVAQLLASGVKPPREFISVEPHGRKKGRR